MIVLGLVLLLLGLVLGIGILWTAGIVVLIVGAVLMLLGRPVVPSAAEPTTGDRSLTRPLPETASQNLG